MAENSDLSLMLSAENKLDGNNYPMWAYMMHHVLVAKGFWNIVQGFDVHPGSMGADSGTVEDGANSCTVAAIQWELQVLAHLVLQQQLSYPQLNRVVGMVEMRRLMP